MQSYHKIYAFFSKLTLKQIKLEMYIKHILPTSCGLLKCFRVRVVLVKRLSGKGYLFKLTLRKFKELLIHFIAKNFKIRTNHSH